MTTYAIKFRAQFGDIGPVEVRSGDGLTYQGLQERLFELWPKSNTRGDDDDRVGGNAGENEGCMPSVSRRGSPDEVETADDIKFIFNGRVLTTTAEVREVCAGYFGQAETTAEEERANIQGLAGGKEDLVLILHAVVRPPSAPMKRKGKKKVVDGGTGEVSGSQAEPVLCPCCQIQ